MNHKSTNVIATAVAGLFLSFGVVLAEAHTESIRTEAFENLEQERQELRQRIEEQREALRTQQEEMRLKVQEAREASLEELRARQILSGQELRERAKEHQDRFKAERDRLRDEVEKRKEEFEARAKEMREAAKEELERRKEEFREKLAQIREERHKQLAENLSGRMNNVNQHMSDAALKYIDALSLVLSKIEARTSIVEDASGNDLTQVREAIAQARLRIEEAREAVLAQKSKEYVIEIQSQDTLGQDIRTAFHELRDDHQQLRQDVLHPLRNLVHDVMQQLKAEAEQEGKDIEAALEEEFENQEE